MPTTAPATASSEPSNLLLAMLDATSLSLLEPHLRDITLKQYDILQDADAPIQYVYFPVTAMISLLAILETGEAIEIAAIGREGAVGTKFGARPQLFFCQSGRPVGRHSIEDRYLPIPSGGDKKLRYRRSRDVRQRCAGC